MWTPEMEKLADDLWEAGNVHSHTVLGQAMTEEKPESVVQKLKDVLEYLTGDVLEYLEGTA